MKKFLLVPLILLTGCESLGVSSNDCLKRVAAAEVSITESYETTTKLFVSGVISASTAKKALNATDTANALTDKAVLLCPTDEPQATTLLTDALSLLAEAKTFIGG